jgi:hypothetical protein
MKYTHNKNKKVKLKIVKEYEELVVIIEIAIKATVGPLVPSCH